MPTFRKNDALPTDHVFCYELRGVQSIKLVPKPDQLRRI